MTRLGVNIDHVATLRQARLETFPDPLLLALEAVKGGANGITAHLREDRRHIQTSDIVRLKKNLRVPLNMEMAVSDDVVRVAVRWKPNWACLVPENRRELTTEGGLDVNHKTAVLSQTIQRLHRAGVKVSLFIDPECSTVRKAAQLGADAVELHTGRYARLWPRPSVLGELKRLTAAARLARSSGLIVNAGHGINYDNVTDLSRIFDFDEYNIGFAIVARSVSVGLARAVGEMKKRMKR